MKKIALLTLLAGSLYTTNVSAQACTPDPTIPLSNVGVYPIPPDNSATGPDTLHLVLYRNCPFEFTFTAVVPDSINLSPTTRINLETVEITTITGYPAGIGVTGAYSPKNAQNEGVSETDQIYNDLTKGCLKIGGTTSAAIGNYPLIISVKVNGALTVTIPSSTFNYQYVLEVRENPGFCPLSVLQTPEGEVELSQNRPNPFSTVTDILLNSPVAKDYSFEVFDVVGKRVHSQIVNAVSGQNRISFDGSSLANGIYFYTIGTDGMKATEKMVIQH